MQAIILAGGKGTRLGQLTMEIPKPMIKVGGLPIIEHQIVLLKRHSITNIIIVVNHLKTPIIDYLGDGSKLGVSITYYEEEKPLGTSGAIPLFKEKLEDSFLILYGDVMMEMDLDRLINFHETSNSEATLVIHPNDHPYDSDLVEIDSNNKITAFHSKPHAEGLYYKNMVNAGVYLFNKTLVDHIPEGIKNDFGKDLFPSWIHSFNFYGYNTPEYLKDMGTPDRLEKVEADLLSGKIEAKSLLKKQKAIFLDRDGVINEDLNLIHKPEDLILYPFAAEAIKKINQSTYLGIVVTNQSVVARNLCTIEELEYIHKKLDTELGNDGAKLDELYYCPYHPDKGYPEENPEYKKEHPWRKPSPGMLLQAEKDFNIDLSESYIIGDRESDILAGKNAGVKTIAVRTGHGYQKASVSPDFIFQNLKEAVDFVIDDPLKNSCQEILQQVEEPLLGDDKIIILIGGNAQSGKSTLSKRLSIALSTLEIPNRIIPLDHFLIPANDRKKAKDVFERFNIAQIPSLIDQFLSGKELKLPVYHKNPELDRNQETLLYDDEKVIIIEGVPALASEELRNIANLSIFVNSDFHIYKERFYKLYSWKGFPISKIDQLFDSRVKDEFELINETQKFADLTLNLSQ